MRFRVCGCLSLPACLFAFLRACSVCFCLPCWRGENCWNSQVHSSPVFALMRAGLRTCVHSCIMCVRADGLAYLRLCLFACLYVWFFCLPTCLLSCCVRACVFSCFVLADLCVFDWLHVFFAFPSRQPFALFAVLACRLCVRV